MNSKGPIVVYTGGGQRNSQGEAHLWVCSGKNIGRRFALDKPNMVIGRSSTADIPVVDERVSQQHAVIEQREGVHFLRDLGSTNGCFINNQRLHEAPLRDGDLLQVGETVFEYLSYEERNLTITLRGQTDDDAVPAALRNEARQMLQNARHLPEPQIIPASSHPGSDVPLVQVPATDAGYNGGGTVDYPAQDPAATGPGMSMAPNSLHRPARGVAPMYPPGVPYNNYGAPPYPMAPQPPMGGSVGPATYDERQGFLLEEEGDTEALLAERAMRLSRRQKKTSRMPQSLMI